MADIRLILQNVQKYRKTVLSFMVGDFGVKLPYFENLVVFRSSGDTRKLPISHVGLPAFIADPLPKYLNSRSFSLREFRKKPTVGFCGQANDSLINAGVEVVKTMARNIRSAAGISQSSPQQLLSTSYLRASVIENLRKSDRIEDNFILRKKYRAGATNEELRKRTTLEFYENIRDSDYVICVRGAGNFSVRFYETLAMGRIPIFLDTHCLLPLSDKIDWKKHVVWVSYEKRHEIAQIVCDFHNSMSREEFQHIQNQNRKLWEDKLTLGGFFKTYINE